jgi:hypothetical protein
MIAAALPPIAMPVAAVGLPMPAEVRRIRCRVSFVVKVADLGLA